MLQSKSAGMVTPLMSVYASEFWARFFLATVDAMFYLRPAADAAEIPSKANKTMFFMIE